MWVVLVEEPDLPPLGSLLENRESTVPWAGKPTSPLPAPMTGTGNELPEVSSCSRSYGQNLIIVLI